MRRFSARIFRLNHGIDLDESKNLRVRFHTDSDELFFFNFPLR